MAVINSKNYFGLSMNAFDKKMFIDKYVVEVPEEYRAARSVYAQAYMEETDLNYVLSKPAQETIEKIKLDNPVKVFKMLIDHADDVRMWKPI